MFVHQLKKASNNYIFVPITGNKVKSVKLFVSGTPVEYKQINEGVFIYLKNIQLDEVDTIYQIDIE